MNEPTQADVDAVAKALLATVPDPRRRLADYARGQGQAIRDIRTGKPREVVVIVQPDQDQHGFGRSLIRDIHQQLARTNEQIDRLRRLNDQAIRDSRTDLNQMMDLLSGADRAAARRWLKFYWRRQADGD